MTWPTVQSDFSKRTSRCHHGVRVIGVLAVALAMSASSAQDSIPGEKFLTGKNAQDSLQRMRSATLQGVPLSDAIADLQRSLQYAIVLDHRVDPEQPVTLTTGLVDSQEMLRQVAQAVGADVAFTDRFAAVGPPDSVSRLRTVVELRRNEVRGLRTKLGTKTYQLWFNLSGAGWPDLMRPDRFLTQQIQAAEMTRQPGFQVPHDLWRSQQLPPLDLIDRLTVVLNQFDQTFQVDENGGVEITPVEQNPTVRRRMRIPADRREAVESLLRDQVPEVEAIWSGSRVTLQGRIELMEAVEGVIRNKDSSQTQEGLKTQLFTMSIPVGSTVSRVIESLKASGISIRIRGLSELQRQKYLQKRVQLDARRMPGAEFFPALLKADGGTVQVEDDSVVIQF